MIWSKFPGKHVGVMSIEGVLLEQLAVDAYLDTYKPHGERCPVPVGTGRHRA